MAFSPECRLRSFFNLDRILSSRSWQQGRSEHAGSVKLSAGVTGPPYLLEIDGLFTQGSRLGRTLGESVGGIFALDGSD
jgi:hypothetical protein